MKMLCEKKVPGRSKSLKLRAKILDTAMSLFVDKGVSNTTIELIAKEVGVSKQTIYSYFDSKNELFRLSLEKAGEVDFDIRLTDLNESTLKEVLVGVAKQYLDLLLSKEYVGFYKNCLSYPGAQSEYSKVFYHSIHTKCVSELKCSLSMINDQFELGIDEFDIGKASIFFINLIQGEISLCYVLDIDSENKYRGDYIEQAVDFFLHGVTRGR